jgi:hypothetical protein
MSNGCAALRRNPTSGEPIATSAWRLASAPLCGVDDELLLVMKLLAPPTHEGEQPAQQQQS